ncbi:MAG: N-6 DNA methylase, partial [Bradymonadaceae bacterium]
MIDDGHRPWLPLAGAMTPHLDDLQDTLKDGLALENGPESTALCRFRRLARREIGTDDYVIELAHTFGCMIAHSVITEDSPSPWADRAATVLGDQSPALHHALSPLLFENSRFQPRFDALEDVVRDEIAHLDVDLDQLPYLYEAIVSASSANARRSGGVYYTPLALVSFIVRSVDELLIDEFGLPAGLADEGGRKGPFLRFLDPAMGTGLFLFEIVDRIAERLGDLWRDEGLDEADIARRWTDYVQTSLAGRLQGYDICLAPIILAHLELARRLRARGCHTSGPVGFHWANPLDAEFGPDLFAPHRHTVIVGNPPYRSVSSHQNSWLDGLLDDYRQTPTGPMEERGNRNQLQDDYVKFLRLADHGVGSAGIVAMVTNSSFYEGPWFRAMRYQLMKSSD